MSSQERQLPQTLVKTFDLSLKKFFSGYLKVCGLFSCVEKSNTEVNTPTQMSQQIYACQKYSWRKLTYMHFEGKYFHSAVLTVAFAAYFTTHGCRTLHTNTKQTKNPMSKLEMKIAARVKKFRSQIPRPLSVRQQVNLHWITNLR